jgi:hypothetical protein
MSNEPGPGPDLEVMLCGSIALLLSAIIIILPG